MRVLAVILGILLAIIGFVSIGMPLFTTALIGILTGIFLLINGIVSIVRGASGPHKSAFDIIFGIIAALAGVIILANGFAGAVVTEIIVIIFLCIFLIAGGIARMVAAFQLKAAKQPWGLLLVIGIISIIVGILLLVFELVGFVFIHAFVSVGIIVGGFNLIFGGFAGDPE